MAAEPVTEAQRIAALSLTENMSVTYSTTLEPCLDFFFDVMQKTPREETETKLASAWEADPLLTLKLIFQLRDIRDGKGAQEEFFHCLLWLYEKHPDTLLENMQHLPRHGYWKDLYLLIEYLVEGTVKQRKKQPRVFRRGFRAPRADSNKIPKNATLEVIAKQRVENQITKKQLKKYFETIPGKLRKDTKAEYRRIIEKLQMESSKKAAEDRKLKKREADEKVKQRLSTDDKFRQFYDKVVKLSTEALRCNMELVSTGKPLPSKELCGKWIPTIGCSIDRATRLGKSIALALYDESQHRQPNEPHEDFKKRVYMLYQREYLTPLRKAMSVPEVFMSGNNWGQLPYERVPSVCMKNNKQNFAKHDKDRFQAFLDQVKSGKKKIASGALMPHQIVTEISKSDDPQMTQVTQMQWESYVKKLRESGLLSSALAVCDVSGSMSGIPMEVAIALSLLVAELTTPPFNGYICSFSESPQLHLVNQPTLQEKISFVRQMDWGMNTNVQAVFDLILDMAKGIDLPSDKMIKTIFIFSDMEFDHCGGEEYATTDYEIICRKFQNSGYTVPSIVFWNLRGGDRSKPVLKNQQNVALVSGFSGQMLKSFLENGTFPNPYESMLNTLGTKYDHLKVID